MNQTPKARRSQLLSTIRRAADPQALRASRIAYPLAFRDLRAQADGLFLKLSYQFRQ